MIHSDEPGCPVLNQLIKFRLRESGPLIRHQHLHRRHLAAGRVPLLSHYHGNSLVLGREFDRVREEVAKDLRSGGQRRTSKVASRVRKGGREGGKEGTSTFAIFAGSIFTHVLGLTPFASTVMTTFLARAW